MWYPVKKKFRDERTEWELRAALEELTERLPRCFYTDYEVTKFVIDLSRLKSLLKEVTEN